MTLQLPTGSSATLLATLATAAGLALSLTASASASAGGSATAIPVAAFVEPRGELHAGLQAALESALTVPAARVEVVAVELPVSDCRPDPLRASYEIPNAIEGTSRLAVKVNGARPHGGGTECQLWLWVRVRVVGRVPVARRSIRPGELLGDAGAVTLEEREIHPGRRPATLCEGCVADRFIGAGQVVDSAAVRAPGLRGGAPVKVMLVSGALVAEQMGRAIACGRGQCAVLPSGKHVEGTLVDGSLVVNLP